MRSTREHAAVRQSRPRAVGFILDNLTWLGGSLALAVLVWYAAVSAQDPVEQRRYTSRVPIEIKHDEGLLVLNAPPTTAQVMIRALRSVWDRLDVEDISVQANLSNRGPGSYDVELHGALLRDRRGSVTDIQPGFIRVELVRRAEKLVNVVVQATADPPVGFIPTMTPAQATGRVVGPEAQVRQVESLLAQISLRDQRARFSSTVTLVPVDADRKPVAGVTVTPVEVVVDVDIQPRPGTTEVSVIPNFVGELPRGYVRGNYTWEPNRIVVRGDQSAITAMNGVLLTDRIDLTGKTQTFTQTVKLALPFGVNLPDPKDITVTVKIEPVIVSREFADIPVQPQGLDPADFQITVQPDRVSVIVKGPQSVVEALTASDISVFAPLSGQAAGKVTVTLQASISRSEINSRDVVIPNARAEVTIVARNPTPTPTQGPTRTATPTPTPTATPTPQ